MKSIFILAAGTQARWNDGKIYPQYSIKQLVPIGKTILIVKTQGMVLDIELPLKMNVVTKNRIIMNNSIEYLIPEGNQYLMDTMISTLSSWEGDDIVFLMGDTLYDKKELSLILNNKKDIQFFGNDNIGEVYGFTFKTKVRDMILGMMNECREMAFRNKGTGKMLSLYRIVNKSPEGVLEYNYDLWKNINKTIDFDSHQNYKDYLESLDKKKI